MAYVEDLCPEDAETKTDARQSKYLRAIEFAPYDEHYRFSQNKIENTAAKKIDLDLDLGDQIENQLIVLRTADAIKREFKIEQQFETSLAVSDEGPHIDLTDWKHYRSEWRELKKVGAESFLTRQIGEAESSRFPPVSKREIYNAVLKAGGKRWADEARTCKTVDSGPCYISVSTISFRIKVKEEGRWKVINQINFMIPMGC